MTVATTATGACTCGACAFLIDDPEEFERALPGILILSSGQGDSSAHQGLCRFHRRMVTADMTCGHARRRASEERS